MTKKDERPWLRIAEGGFPVKTVVEVCGESGMARPKHIFLTLAYHDAEYRPHNPWRGIQNDALSDSGWVPLYWRTRGEFPQELHDRT